MSRVLAVRSDNVGDVLLAGPAIRALARRNEVMVLAGPVGASAAALLPGVASVAWFDTPWIAADPPPVEGTAIAALVDRIAGWRIDEAFVFTSDRQSALPMALLLRLAGVPWIGAVSREYPGSLLDLRIRSLGDVHEVDRALTLVRRAGYEPAPDGDGALRVEPGRLGPVGAADLPAAYVVVHPGASVPARTWSPEGWAAAVLALRCAGHQVVVTGGSGEDPDRVVRDAADDVVDLVGRTSLAELAAVLTGATALCCGNTGVMHLGAATGVPIVAVFPPTVPVARWRPWRVPAVLLGDHEIDCALCHARVCPRPGQPCTAPVSAGAVVDAVAAIGRPPVPTLAGGTT